MRRACVASWATQTAQTPSMATWMACKMLQLSSHRRQGCHRHRLRPQKSLPALRLCGRVGHPHRQPSGWVGYPRRQATVGARGRPRREASPGPHRPWHPSELAPGPHRPWHPTQGLSGWVGGAAAGTRRSSVSARTMVGERHAVARTSRMWWWIARASQRCRSTSAACGTPMLV